MSSSIVFRVCLDMCPVHTSVKEVTSLKINIAIKKNKENSYFTFLSCEKCMSWNLFSSNIFISSLAFFSSSLMKILIIDKIC